VLKRRSLYIYMSKVYFSNLQLIRQSIFILNQRNQVLDALLLLKQGVGGHYCIFRTANYSPKIGEINKL
jgi:hypothetical protein